MRILLTRAATPRDRLLAERHGVELVAKPLIDIQFPDEAHIPDAPAFAFTSVNAVEGFLRLRPATDLDGKRVYAVGSVTAAALPPHTRVSPGRTGAEMAAWMLEAGETGPVCHPTGDRRRPELARLLGDAGVQVLEPIVYFNLPPTLIELPSEPVDAVVFMSPSAVERFLELGWDRRLPVPYAAIGPTTAAALGNRPVLVAPEADLDRLIELLKVEV